MTRTTQRCVNDDTVRHRRKHFNNLCCHDWIVTKRN
jgi:hypothetical protein